MDIIEILRQDYAKFPIDQSYHIYAADVYFQDPLSRFRGLNRYQQMIKFIQICFKSPQLELHQIDRVDSSITTRWTLSWNTPLPWYPRIKISGRSEMLLDENESLAEPLHSCGTLREWRIVSHIDYWDCSPLDVLGQHFKI
jgi:hypothetical protein